MGGSSVKHTHTIVTQCCKRRHVMCERQHPHSIDFNLKVYFAELKVFAAVWRSVMFSPGGHESAGCCSFQTVACEMKILPAFPHKLAGLYHWTSSMGQRSCGLRLINEETVNSNIITLQLLLKPYPSSSSQDGEVNHNVKFPP